MKIAIIGTNGLLSNCVAQYCNVHNYEVEMYGIEKPEGVEYTNFYFVDLFKDSLDYSKLKRNNLIVYAAGAGIQSNLKERFNLIYNLNVYVPISICNNLNELGYHGTFITFGSYFEIGENTEDKRFTEEMLLFSSGHVQNDYSISKRLLSRFISSFEAPFKTWHFILPTIYGEKESPHRLIPYTINALKNNLPVSFTSGNQVRQFIYINEIPEIIFKSVDSDLDQGIYNVEGTETLMVKDIVHSLFSKFGLKPSDDLFGKTNRKDTGMVNLQLDGSKLLSKIDFRPTIKISDIYAKY